MTIHATVLVQCRSTKSYKHRVDLNIAVQSLTPSSRDDHYLCLLQKLAGIWTTRTLALRFNDCAIKSTFQWPRNSTVGVAARVCVPRRLTCGTSRLPFLSDESDLVRELSRPTTLRNAATAAFDIRSAHAIRPVRPVRACVRARVCA